MEHLHTVLLDMFLAAPVFVGNALSSAGNDSKNDAREGYILQTWDGDSMWDSTLKYRGRSASEPLADYSKRIIEDSYQRLKKEGVDIVQIDDPHLCLFVDPAVRAEYEDPEFAADFAVDMVNQVVESFDGLKLAVHLCRRAGARVRGEKRHEGGYDPIIKQLNKLQVHHLTMEFTSPGAGDVSVFGQLRSDFEIGLGCVSCHPDQVDSPDIIVERVEQALRYIEPQRITLNPDCGFAPGSAAEVSMDEVYTKLKNEVEAAHRLRERYA